MSRADRLLTNHHCRLLRTLTSAELLFDLSPSEGISICLESMVDGCLPAECQCVDGVEDYSPTGVLCLSDCSGGLDLLSKNVKAHSHIENLSSSSASGGRASDQSACLQADCFDSGKSSLEDIPDTNSKLKVQIQTDSVLDYKLLEKQAKKIEKLDVSDYNSHMLDIYNRVLATGTYNYRVARLPLPSGLNVESWKLYLQDYHDGEIVNFLEFGWPSNFQVGNPLKSTLTNHGSGVNYNKHIDFYIEKEIGLNAMLGPFSVPPVAPVHISPIMTRPKKGSEMRRVVVDLSWPRGMSVNDAIPGNEYLGAPINLTLPTIDFMADRVRELGQGCYMYKLDLSRGYRQLRLDPLDWPIMTISHRGEFFMDVCPPFGLRTAAMMMQRTSLAACHIHGKCGFSSKPYIDDFGGAHLLYEESGRALSAMQSVFRCVGLDESVEKTWQPTMIMPWLGVLVNSWDMTLSIPEEKLDEVLQCVKGWECKKVATRREVQSLVGLLNFVGGVSPPTRIYTNRILNFLREMPQDGYVEITNEFLEDVRFFQRLMPHYNGISVLDKTLVPCTDQLEVDACLEGSGGLCGDQFYSRLFPDFIIQEKHSIAHLEMLNMVVAFRLWSSHWEHQKLQVYTDNMNTCVALQTGRSRDRFMQACTRTIFLLSAAYDIELLVCHTPGTTLQCADALSRSHITRYREMLNKSGWLEGRCEIQVPDEYYMIEM